MIVGGPSPVGFVPVSSTHMYMFVLEHAQDNSRRETADQLEQVRSLLAAYGGLAGRTRDALEPSHRIPTSRSVCSSRSLGIAVVSCCSATRPTLRRPISQPARVWPSRTHACSRKSCAARIT
jgi:hypothetical protein